MAKSNNKTKNEIAGSEKKKLDNKRFASQGSTLKSQELLYGKSFFIWMLIGLACIILGFILMGGGHQDPNSWNPDEIYSFRRTALAPIVIIIGLVIEVYAIFKK